jgi:hypothetical protein
MTTYLAVIRSMNGKTHYHLVIAESAIQAQDKAESFYDGLGYEIGIMPPIL